MTLIWANKIKEENLPKECYFTLVETENDVKLSVCDEDGQRLKMVLSINIHTGRLTLYNGSALSAAYKQLYKTDQDGCILIDFA
jgi:hypothetical protein